MSKFHLSILKSMTGEIIADLETVDPEKLRMWSDTILMQADKARRAHARQHLRGSNTPDSCATHKHDLLELALCHCIINVVLNTQPKPLRGDIEELVRKALLAGR